MKLRGHSTRSSRRGPGFSLIEMMVVVAIVAVVAGMAMVAYEAVGRRGSIQNAAFDLQGVLNQARTRAQERGAPMWVVIYPQARRTAVTGGPGAYLLIEDRNLDFSLATYTPNVLPEDPGGNVLEVNFLEDYHEGQVRFGTSGAAGFGAPFSTLTPSPAGCSFCSGTPSRGAIVFYPEGVARFVDGSGMLLANSPSHSLGFLNVGGKTAYLFAISGPTSYIAAFSK